MRNSGFREKQLYQFLTSEKLIKGLEERFGVTACEDYFGDYVS